ncbi:TonB-dependent hemoglobin/transferrin/lactoferrin family receptor [Microvirga sp. W0021]|uniref:TonB-dependent hemoglobin/transferrin/lactoferrin family receptor n=1 Tax=Hohaiivirga grylli TaxID=3133970 RepID=A0ABV0BJN5_9HYPH
MRMFKRGMIHASVSLSAIVAVSGSVWAQDAAQKPRSAMDEITVTADRTESTIYDTPSTVTIINDQKIDRDNINTMGELVRDEPGVSVGNQPGRSGASSYTIRGIGDNRVRIQIDDIKIADYPGSNKGSGTYTRNFIDFDALKQVEIIRGPSSALYGSDAIGGVVSYITKDPGDFLTKDKNWFASGKLGYDSSDLSKTQTITGAARMGDWETMVIYTHRRGHELRPNTDEQPNSQRYEVNNVLGKLVYNGGELGRFRLTGEYTYRTTGTNLITEQTTTGGTRGMPYTRVFDSYGDDTMSRPRISLDWTKTLDWAIADTVKINGYWTEVRRDDSTIQYRGSSTGRAPSVPTVVRDSDNGYHQDIRGADIQFTADRELWGWQHSITYGGSFDVTTSSRPRDRYELNVLTGRTTKTVAGETYPNKNWPDTRTTQGGIYIQDIIQYGKLRLIPALRYDYYHLEPHPDAAFANSNSRDFVVESQTHHAFSPKFGVTYDLLDWLRVYGQYSHGFRAPPYDNANFGFTNSVSRYEILPNGNLKPETSNGFEIGFKGKFDNGSSFQLNGFYNLYDNFIDTVTVGTSSSGLTQFQYQNLSKVRIWGIEAKGDWHLTEEWSVFGSLAYAHGEDEDTKKAIDSVDPFSFTAGVRYKNVAGWGGEVRARGAARKSRVSDDGYYRPGGYAVMDASFFYDYSEHLSFNAGVYNVFDRKYFSAQDVVGVSSSSSILELYRSPGRTIAVNATVRW